ncbi:MAG: sensor domain-containing diguanylate cyclase [Candidatus Krumholzibacteria bacterium]|nr:sensor domain-containing diguanylate cyclase [Candidatus Krumholzibacteria bacterium]
MTRNIDEKDILFKTFAEITSLISSGKDNRIIFHKILDNALDILPSNQVYLILLENQEIIKYTARLQDRGRMVTVENMPKSMGIVNWLHREVEAVHATDKAFGLDLSLLASECIKEENICGSVISAPLMARNSLFGILVAVGSSSERGFSDDDIHLLSIMANQAAIAFENYLLYKKLEVESITDGLTGIYNYRFLIRSIELEIKRAKRFNYVFSFVMMDVDNLKKYNDRNGHLSGSKALKDFAGIISRSCREIDLVFKYGGDEFALILHQTGLKGAVSLSKRILRAVQSFEFDGKTPGLLTCSIGIATYPKDASELEELIDKADNALYCAKSMGKNGLVSYRDMKVLNSSRNL